jgi:hypothetical protein
MGILPRGSVCMGYFGVRAVYEESLLDDRRYGGSLDRRAHFVKDELDPSRVF